MVFACSFVKLKHKWRVLEFNWYIALCILCFHMAEATNICGSICSCTSCCQGPRQTRMGSNMSHKEIFFAGPNTVFSFANWDTAVECEVIWPTISIMGREWATHPPSVYKLKGCVKSVWKATQTATNFTICVETKDVKVVVTWPFITKATWPLDDQGVKTGNASGNGGREVTSGKTGCKIKSCTLGSLR